MIRYACFLTLTVLMVGCGPKTSGPVEAPPIKLPVATVLSKRIVEWDEYIGRFEAIQSVDVKSRVTGYLQSIHFVEGDLVNKGDLLFVIDPRPYEAELRTAQAAKTQAEASLEASKVAVKESEAKTNQAVAQDDLAKSLLGRARTLLQTNTIAREEYEVRESAAQQSSANLDAARAAVATAQAAVSTAHATLEGADAMVANAQLNLEYTRIVSPINGRISRRYVTIGNMISGSTNGSSSTLTNIVSLSPIHCYFDADEQAYLKYTRLSQSGKRASSRDVKNPVYTGLMDEKGFPHKGHMDFVDNTLDHATATIRGRAIFANEDMILTPGMFARVRLPGSGSYDAMLVPDAAIGFDQSTEFVYVATADNQLRRQPVELGPLSFGLRIVRKGLAPEDRVVIGNLQKIMPGAKYEFDAATIEPLETNTDLPNEYVPVPPEQWLKIDGT